MILNHCVPFSLFSLVGNGYRFLIIFHLLPFYLISNAIIACGYENNPNKWGQLNPDVNLSSYRLYSNIAQVWLLPDKVESTVYTRF